MTPGPVRAGTLTVAQRELVDALVADLAPIAGIEAIVLGGSHARGRARPDSDVDLGLLYCESAPFAIDAIRELCGRVDDAPDPVVTEFYEWGPWVNGGAWLSIRKQRVDLLYRSLDHVERVIGEAEAGRYELHYAQQPPFGFWSGTYLGEISVMLPLFDPHGRVAALKQRVVEYPEALRRTVVQNYLGAVEFGLEGFARKLALRGDVYGTVGCLARLAHQLVLVSFALNRRHPVNDKTAIAEIAEFSSAPRDFGIRLEALLSHPGRSADELGRAVEELAALFRETVALAGDLYRSRALPPSSRVVPTR